MIEWAAHHMVSRIPNPIFWSLFHESDGLKKKRNENEWVKFFWFARKLVYGFEKCENMGRKSHILYQKSGIQRSFFCLSANCKQKCCEQVKRAAHSIVSRISISKISSLFHESDGSDKEKNNI